jgi:hypothetical protein
MPLPHGVARSDFNLTVLRKLQVFSRLRHKHQRSLQTSLIRRFCRVCRTRWDGARGRRYSMEQTVKSIYRNNAILNFYDIPVYILLCK